MEAGPAKPDGHPLQTALAKAAIHWEACERGNSSHLGCHRLTSARGPVWTLKLNWSIMGYLDASLGLPSLLWFWEAAPGSLLNQ